MVQALIAEILSITDREWMVDAACQDSTYDVFFPTSSDAYDQARAICATCPVKSECFDYVTANPQDFGMWAGLTPPERRRIRRRSIAPSL